MYIDDDLVIDLGGVGTSAVQRIDVDRLGLADGETYELRLLYAQRRTSTARLGVRTNIQLATGPVVPPLTEMYD